MSYPSIVYRLLYFGMIIFLTQGCLVTSNLKFPEKSPEIVKTYKHVILRAGTTKMKDTGVSIAEGDIYTVLVTGRINYCPRGGCNYQNVKPELGWPFITRIGDSESAIHFRPLGRHYNPNHFTRTQYNGSGNLYAGYREGPVDRKGNALRPEYYSDDMGAFYIDIIVWQSDDWVKIADFLEEQSRTNPDNAALSGAYDEAAKFRKIGLARIETTKALAETKKQIETFTQESEKEITLDPAIAEIARPPGETDAATRNKIADLEAQLQKLTLMLAGLDDMKLQLNDEQKKSEKLTAELDEFEARERDLRSKLADGSKVNPVIVIAAPKSQTRTEAGKITLSGVVQDDTGVVNLEIQVNQKWLDGEFRRGVTVSGAAAAKSVDFSETIVLQKGENRVWIRAVDADGLVAEKNLVIYRLEVRRNVWAVIIGINTYNAIANLSYAVNDAREFHRILVEKNRVPTENVTLLLNEKANLVTLRSILGTRLKKKARKEDMVIVYFAGHGATERDTMSPDGDGLEKYLLPVDANPDDLYASALPMRELSHIFKRLRSDRLIFIADACYSGATGGRTISITGGMRARISDKFLDRISSGKGRIILTASGANEVSAEKPELKHGVFTHFLIKGMEGAADANHDGLVTVDEVYNYVSTEVPRETDQEQHPVKKGTVEGQLVIGVVK